MGTKGRNGGGFKEGRKSRPAKGGELDPTQKELRDHLAQGKSVESSVFQPPVPQTPETGSEEDPRFAVVQAFIETGDKDGAQRMLRNILHVARRAEEKERAKELLESIGGKYYETEYDRLSSIYTNGTVPSDTQNKFRELKDRELYSMDPVVQESAAKELEAFIVEQRVAAEGKNGEGSVKEALPASEPVAPTAPAAEPVPEVLQTAPTSPAVEADEPEIIPPELQEVFREVPPKVVEKYAAITNSKRQKAFIENLKEAQRKEAEREGERRGKEKKEGEGKVEKKEKEAAVNTRQQDKLIKLILAEDSDAEKILTTRDAVVSPEERNQALMLLTLKGQDTKTRIAAFIGGIKTSNKRKEYSTQFRLLEESVIPEPQSEPVAPLTPMPPEYLKQQPKPDYITEQLAAMAKKKFGTISPKPGEELSHANPGVQPSSATFKPLTDPEIDALVRGAGDESGQSPIEVAVPQREKTLEEIAVENRNEASGVPIEFEGEEFDKIKSSYDQIHRLLKRMSEDSEAAFSAEDVGFEYRVIVPLRDEQGNLVARWENVNTYHDLLRLRATIPGELRQESDELVWDFGSGGNFGKIATFGNTEKLWNRLDDPSDTLSKYKDEFDSLVNGIRSEQLPDEYAQAVARGEVVSEPTQTGEKSRSPELIPLDTLKETLQAQLEGNSKIKSVDGIEIVAKGDGLQLFIDLVLKGGKEAVVEGLMVNDGGRPVFKNINAVRYPVFGKSAVEAAFADLGTETQKYFEQHYGQPISNIQMGESGLTIEFAPPATAEPAIEPDMDDMAADPDDAPADIQDAVDKDATKAENRSKFFEVMKKAGEKFGWYKSTEEKLILRRDELDAQGEQIPGVERYFRKWGERYNKMPFKYKVLLGASLGLGTVATAGTLAMALPLLGIAGQRAAGLSTMYLKFEKKSHDEKWGKEKAMLKAGFYTVAMGLTMKEAIELASQTEAAHWAQAKVEGWLGGLLGHESVPSSELPKGATAPKNIPEVSQPEPAPKASASPPAAPAAAAAAGNAAPAPEAGATHTPAPGFSAENLAQQQEIINRLNKNGSDLSMDSSPEEITAAIEKTNQAIAETKATIAAAGKAPTAGAEAAAGEAPAPHVAPKILESVGATPGKGYEYMMQKLVEKLPADFDKDSLPKTSDMYRLLHPEPKSFAGVLHDIATENEFYKENGTSVQIDLDSKLSVDTKGNIWFGDNNDILAPEGAKVTPAYHPEAASAPKVGITSLPHVEAGDLTAEQDDAAKHIEPPPHEEAPAPVASGTPSASEQPLAWRTGSGGELVDSSGNSVRAGVSESLPGANRFGIVVPDAVPQVYTGSGGGQIFAYGGSAAERGKVILEHLMKNPNGVVFAADEAGKYRVPWHLVEGKVVAGPPMRTSGILGLFSTYLKPPGPEEFVKVIK